jgi:hypothetical protein
VTAWVRTDVVQSLRHQHWDLHQSIYPVPLKRSGLILLSAASGLWWSVTPAGRSYSTTEQCGRWGTRWSGRKVLGGGAHRKGGKRAVTASISSGRRRLRWPRVDSRPREEGGGVLVVQLERKEKGKKMKQRWWAGALLNRRGAGCHAASGEGGPQHAVSFGQCERDAKTGDWGGWYVGPIHSVVRRGLLTCGPWPQ